MYDLQNISANFRKFHGSILKVQQKYEITTSRITGSQPRKK